MKKYFRNSKRPQTVLKNLIFELKNTSLCSNRKLLLERLLSIVRQLNYFEFSNLNKAIVNIFIFHKISKKDYFTITDINCKDFNSDYVYELRVILHEQDDKKYKKVKLIKLLNELSKTKSGVEFLNSIEHNENFLTILKYCDI
jgi:hypothetical protein